MTWQERRGVMAGEAEFYPKSSEPEVAELLHLLCRMMGAKRVLEVGCWMGATSVALIEAMGGESCDAVHLIDAADNRHALLKDLPHCFHLGKSAEEIPKLTGKFDLIYLDGDHSYEGCLGDICALERLGTVGGLIVVHDAISEPGVRKALLSLHGGFFKRLVLPTPMYQGRLERTDGVAILQMA